MEYENYYHELLVYKWGPFPSHSVPSLEILERYEKENKKYQNLMENLFVLNLNQNIDDKLRDSKIIEILEIIYPGEVARNNNIKIYKIDRKNFRIFNYIDTLQWRK